MNDARKKQTVCFDVVVAGGGMAGVCAAIAAARHGACTALVQDRPVLGGNSSSEMRVWTVGATAMGRNRYAAEGGIVGELDLENLYRNPEGNPHIWDSLLLDWVLREQNLTLYLNTSALDVQTENGRIRRLTAYQMTTELDLVFEADYFIDCTGDGRIGALAGVSFHQGREGRARFGESLAPESDEPFTLGSTLLLYTRDAGRPVAYHAPDFSYPIDTMHRLITENDKPLSLHTNGCDFWWLETGGERNIVADGDAIRMELQRLVYGVWNYIKNSGRFAADTLELEWVGSLPARRESRRLQGAYTLTQNDILCHHVFPDAVCGGGWPIDTHPPGGIYSKKEACDQRDAGVYQIPLRCLYAQTPENLFFAGRNLSASHLAFASARVMKTCAAMGQAAGTAAAVCLQRNAPPARLGANGLAALRRELLWDDQWIPGAEPEQAIRPRGIRASGHSDFANTCCDAMHRLKEDLWIMLPAMPGCRAVLLRMQADTVLDYTVVCLSGTRDRACDDLSVLGTVRAALDRTARWVRLEFHFSLPPDRDLYLRLSAADNVRLAVSKTAVCGCVGSVGGRTGLRLVNPCFQADGAPAFFAPEQAFTPNTRPTMQPNLWLSRPLSQEPAWLQCTVDATPAALELQLVFDVDLNRDYNQLRPDYYGNGWDRMPPQLVRSFRVLTTPDIKAKQWLCAADIRDNRRRCFHMKLAPGTRAVRLEVVSTWGAPCAGIFGVLLRTVPPGPPITNTPSRTQGGTI